MNPDEFLESLHQYYAAEGTDIPIIFGETQYRFVRWMVANGNFQFEGAQIKSIPENILYNAKEAINNGDIDIQNIHEWCKEVEDWRPGGCTTTVLKNLLAQFP